MSDLKPFMLAAIYGEPPTQSLRQAVFLAPSRELAIAMFVSASHVQQGEEALCVAISVDEIRQDVVEAARRGFVGEAPVVSLASEREGRETLRGAQEDEQRTRLHADGSIVCALCGVSAGLHLRGCPNDFGMPAA